jgi:hypothetical protein
MRIKSPTTAEGVYKFQNSSHPGFEPTIFRSEPHIYSFRIFSRSKCLQTPQPETTAQQDNRCFCFALAFALVPTCPYKFRDFEANKNWKS